MDKIPENSIENAQNKILCISFNQDQGCFACGTESGIRVYNINPYKGTFHRDFSGGIGSVTMLYRSNILALVGGGMHPKYPQNKVMLWDDFQKKPIGELGFKSNVKSVKMRKDRIIIALEQRIFVYQFSNLALLDSIETCKNSQGLCAISENASIILVCPDTKLGYIRIVNYDNDTSISKEAHETGLTAIALTPDGKLCATTSDKGTLIRIFATDTGRKVQELRRGAEKAIIQSLTFDNIGNWLACSSDKGTIHIFSTSNANKVVNKIPLDESGLAREEQKDEGIKNPTSAFKFLKGIVSYFSSEFSFAQFHQPDPRAVVAFGEPGKSQIVVVTQGGQFIRAEFNPKTGGECKLIEEKSLYKDV